MLSTFNVWTDLFDTASTATFTKTGPKTWVPYVDVKEDDSAISVCIELPGVTPEAVTVSVEGSTLTISGTRNTEKNRSHRTEMWSGSFTRKFSIPRDIDTNAIEAELKNGILTVLLPKKPETKARQVQVR